MNATQAKEWLPLIQALAEGKTLQRVTADIDNHTAKWEDVGGAPFSQNQFTSAHLYRIKPEPKKGWYRVGMFRNMLGNYAVAMVVNDSNELDFENGHSFVRWLTDRIEYELPEGDA